MSKQKGHNSKESSNKMASLASKTLQSGKASQSAKSLAGSVLSQAHKHKGK